MGRGSAFSLRYTGDLLWDRECAVFQLAFQRVWPLSGADNMRRRGLLMGDAKDKVYGLDMGRFFIGYIARGGPRRMA